jgi:hypothetical protein
MIACLKCGKPLTIQRIETSVICDKDTFKVVDKGDGEVNFILTDHRNLSGEVEDQEYSCYECGSNEGIPDDILDALYDCGE